MSDRPKSDVCLKAEGDTCATLPPLLKRTLATLPAAAVLEVHTYDVAAREGVPAWCRLTGHTLEAVVETGEDETRFFIRKRSG